MWPLRIASEGVGETFNPFYYVVDVKGNRWWSEDLALKVEAIEELEQVASAQCKLMREAAGIATSMQANYNRVQTLLAARLLENRDVKTPADLPGLQTDTATSPVLRGDSEEPPEEDSQTAWGEGKQSAQTGVSATDHKSSNVGKISRRKSPHNVWLRRGKIVCCCCLHGARKRAANRRTRKTPGKPATREKVASTDIVAAAILGAQTNGWLCP